VRSLNELRDIARVIHEHGKKIYVVLNAMDLDERKKEIILRNMRAMREGGIDGYIISNIDLLVKVCNEYPVIASSLLETKNEETVDFFKTLHVKRIICDRQITKRDIKKMARVHPDIEFEVFIEGAGCRSLDSYCHPQIAACDNEYVHTCFYPFHLSAIERTQTFLNKNEMKSVSARLSMPLITCGICALYYFRKYKVHSLKIVGRGYDADRKVKNVGYVKHALQLLEKSRNKKDYYAKAKNLFTENYRTACNEAFCYYPHFIKE
jgi:collagenase-like PrtC family protease